MTIEIIDGDFVVWTDDKTHDLIIPTDSLYGKYEQDWLDDVKSGNFLGHFEDYVKDKTLCVNYLREFFKEIK